MNNNMRGTTTSNASSKGYYPLVQFSKSSSPRNLPESNGRFLLENCGSYQHGTLPFGCKIEWDEWMLVKAFVQPGDVVMEFGARYGTTSCILARAVGSTGTVVSVEPDANVHTFLLHNNHHNQCGAQLVLGTVGDTTLYMAADSKNSNYAIDTSTQQQPGYEAVPNIPLQVVQQALEVPKIHVALIDCEGCIAGLVEEPNGGILDQVDVILMEQDGKIMNDYRPYHQKLHLKGFRCVWYTRDTTDPNKEWSRNMRHSAWIRENSNRHYPPSCSDYVAQTEGLDSNSIVCDTCPTM